MGNRKWLVLRALCPGVPIEQLVAPNYRGAGLIAANSYFVSLPQMLELVPGNWDRRRGLLGRAVNYSQHRDRIKREEHRNEYRT